MQTNVYTGKLIDTKYVVVPETAIQLQKSIGASGGQEGRKGGQKGAREGKKGAREGKKGAAPFYFGLAGTLHYIAALKSDMRPVFGLMTKNISASSFLAWKMSNSK